MHDSALRPLPFLIVAGLAFWVASTLIPEPKTPRPREATVLGIDQLRSNILGQPSSNQSVAVVKAPLGHPEGHVVSTVPKEFPEGEYRFEINADFKVGKKFDEAICIMDLLADTELVAAQKILTIYETKFSKPGVTFRSPAQNGTNIFQTRLYCDGRASILVRSVKLIRNPSSPPRVVIQR